MNILATDYCYCPSIQAGLQAGMGHRFTGLSEEAWCPEAVDSVWGPQCGTPGDWWALGGCLDDAARRETCEDSFSTWLLKVFKLKFTVLVSFPGSPRTWTKNASDGKLGGAWEQGYHSPMVFTFSRQLQRGIAWEIHHLEIFGWKWWPVVQLHRQREGSYQL